MKLTLLAVLLALAGCTCEGQHANNYWKDCQYTGDKNAASNQDPD